jgi:hypothetical protein
MTSIVVPGLDVIGADLEFRSVGAGGFISISSWPDLFRPSTPRCAAGGEGQAWRGHGGRWSMPAARHRVDHRVKPGDDEDGPGDDEIMKVAATGVPIGSSPAMTASKRGVSQ